MNRFHKDWTEIKTNDSWAIFKIMSEFVEGYERMAKIGPSISIFGSARTKPDNKYYQLGVEVARKFAESGYGIIMAEQYGFNSDIITDARKLRGVLKDKFPEISLTFNNL